MSRRRIRGPPALSGHRHRLRLGPGEQGDCAVAVRAQQRPRAGRRTGPARRRRPGRRPSAETPARSSSTSRGSRVSVRPVAAERSGSRSPAASRQPPPNVTRPIETSTTVGSDRRAPRQKGFVPTIGGPPSWCMIRGTEVAVSRQTTPDRAARRRSSPPPGRKQCEMVTSRAPGPARPVRRSSPPLSRPRRSG